MKILITGATGFIGKQIALHLASKGYEVTATGRCNGRLPEASNISSITGDLSDTSFSKKLVKSQEVIVHCVGIAGTWGKREKYIEANVKCTENILQAALNSEVTRFINISSASVYFQYQDLSDLKEDQIPSAFHDYYSESKFLAEELVRSIHGEKLSTVSFRPRFVLGAGDTNIIPRLIRLQKSGLFLLPGDGENKISVTSIGNLLEAVDLSLTAPADNLGTSFNVCDPTPVKMQDFVEHVFSVHGLRTNVVKIPKWMAMALANLIEATAKLSLKKTEPNLQPVKVAAASQEMTLNTDRIQESLGYQGKANWKSAVERYYESLPSEEIDAEISNSKFWTFYKSQHSNDINRYLHVVGSLLALICLYKAFSSANLWYVLLAPLAGYGLAWVGHFFFENNKPATFKAPLASFLGDVKMVFLTLIGQWKD